MRAKVKKTIKKCTMFKVFSTRPYGTPPTSDLPENSLRKQTSSRGSLKLSSRVERSASSLSQTMLQFSRLHQVGSKLYRKSRSGRTIWQVSKFVANSIRRDPLGGEVKGPFTRPMECPTFPTKPLNHFPLRVSEI